MGYLCAKFRLPRPLCSQIRPDVRDRQTDIRQIYVRQHHRLMPPPRGHINNIRQTKSLPSFYVDVFNYIYVRLSADHSTTAGRRNMSVFVVGGRMGVQSRGIEVES